MTSSPQSSIVKVGVQGIILHPEGQGILLGKRLNGFQSGTWGLPGGHLEFGESFEEALSRELKEELGISPTSMRQFGVFNTMFLPSSHHVQIAFIVETYDGTPVNNEPNRCSEIRFFPLDALPEPIFASSLPIIEAYSKNIQ